jgi:CRP-like cAMP-binding protein
MLAPKLLFGAEAARRSLGPGASLVAEKDRCEQLHLLAGGWAYRYALTRQGARQITAILLPGDFVNLDGLLLDRMDYGVRALTPVVVLSLPSPRVLAVAQQHPESMHLLLRRFAIENVMLSRWTLCLGRMPARTRFAHFLCELTVRLAGTSDHAGFTFELPLKQEQIADVLGLTNVHLNRTLQQLRHDGLVQLSGKTLNIPDFAALAKVGEFDPSYLHQTELAQEGLQGHTNSAPPANGFQEQRP